MSILSRPKTWTEVTGTRPSDACLMLEAASMLQTMAEHIKYPALATLMLDKADRLYAACHVDPIEPHERAAILSHVADYRDALYSLACLKLPSTEAQP